MSSYQFRNRFMRLNVILRDFQTSQYLTLTFSHRHPLSSASHFVGIHPFGDLWDYFVITSNLIPVP